MKSCNFLMITFLKSIMCNKIGIPCPPWESIFWYNFSGNNLTLGIKSENGFIPLEPISLTLELYTKYFKLKMWTQYLSCQPININSWTLSCYPVHRAGEKLSLSGAREAAPQILHLPSSLCRSWLMKDNSKILRDFVSWLFK